MLEVEPGSSARAARTSVLIHWAISPAPGILSLLLHVYMHVCMVLVVCSTGVGVCAIVLTRHLAGSFLSLCHMGPGIELTSLTKPFFQPFHYSAPSSSSQETTLSTDSGQRPCGLPMTGREHTSFALMTVQLLSSLVFPSTPIVYAHSGANILGGPLGHTLYSSSHAGKTPESLPYI